MQQHAGLFKTSNQSIRTLMITIKIVNTIYFRKNKP